MKLELKHFVPYLLYDLEIMSEAPPNSREPNIFKMIGIDLKEERIIGIDGVFAEWKDGFCKPILRPLSDLTKDIRISGINRGLFFVPYDELKNVVSKEQWIKVCKTIDVDSGEYSKICDMPHWWVEKLFEWHFDVFGLIENNLAIDINSLK